MKTRNIILWILTLVIIDQAIKIIINTFFLESHIEIIPSLLEFKPTFNTMHSYINVLLNKHYNINIGLWAHLALFLIAQTIVFLLYNFFHKFSKKTVLLDVALIFQLSGMICSLSGNLIWEKGVLDYIYLKPLFVFDLKDLYLQCFAILFILYVHKNKHWIESIKISSFKTFSKNKNH